MTCRVHAIFNARHGHANRFAIGREKNIVFFSFFFLSLSFTPSNRIFRGVRPEKRKIQIVFMRLENFRYGGYVDTFLISVGFIGTVLEI